MNRREFLRGALATAGLLLTSVPALPKWVPKPATVEGGLTIEKLREMKAKLMEMPEPDPWLWMTISPEWVRTPEQRAAVSAFAAERGWRVHGLDEEAT